MNRRRPSLLEQLEERTMLAIDLPLPLALASPAGAVVYSRTYVDQFDASGATASYTIDLAASQTATIVLEPQAGALQGRVALRDAALEIVQSADAADPGQPVILQTAPLEAAGLYQLDLTSLAGTGAYSFTLLLNAAAEAESFGGPANDDASIAQSIASATLPLAASADRLAVVGNVGGPLDLDAADFFAVELSAGQAASFVATDGTTLRLFDPSGTLVAASVAAGDLAVIPDFVAQGAGAYHVSVAAAEQQGYGLTVTRGAAYDLEPNDGLGTTQDVGRAGTVLGGLGLESSTAEFNGEPIDLPINLFDSEGYLWDIEGNGSINDGTNDAYDGGLHHSGFPYPYAAVQSTSGREVKIGPETVFVGEAGSVSVTRRIFVPDDRNFARFLELVTNHESYAQTYTVRIDTNLGSDSSTQLLGTSSGDTTFGVNDDWLLTDDTSAGAGDPALTHVVAGPDGTRPSFVSRDGDDLVFEYELELAPGETRAVLHFAVQNFDRTLAQAQAELLASLPEYALAGLGDGERSAIVNFEVESRDEYIFQVTDATTLTLASSTPADGGGEPNNAADVVLELYYLDGGTPDAPIAVNDNGAPDGRNALVTHAVAAENTGRYRAVVRAPQTGGHYVLAIDSSTVGAVAPAVDSIAVADVVPANGAELSEFPSEIRVVFDRPVLLSSVEASDLTLNGQPASGVTVIDGRTLLFDVASLADDGIHSLHIAAGAMQSLAGEPTEEFSSQFDVDATGPRVISTSLPPAAVVPTGPLTVTIGLSEDLATDFLGPEDVQLFSETLGAFLAPESFAYSPETDELTLAFPALADGHFILTLVSGEFGFVDPRGNALDGELNADLPSGDGAPGGSYVVPFSVDTNESALAAPLDAVQPAGSLVYTRAVEGFLEAGDTDAFTLDVGAEQIVSLGVIPSSPSLRLRIELRGPADELIGAAEAAAVGQAVGLVGTTTATAGIYRVVISSLEGSGSFALSFVLNATIEAESLGGADNAGLSTTESLEASELSLPAGATRLAVLGELAVDDAADVYPIALAAGVVTTIGVAAMDNGAAVRVELVDAGGNLLAIGGTGTLELGSVIEDFVPGSSGMYFARVTSASATAYNLVVTQGAAFGLEFSASNDREQDLGLTGLVLGALGSGTGGAGQAVRVAVINDGGRAFRIVNQLNNSTLFDFDPVPVTATQIDTVAELSAFDVVVIGDQYSQSQLATYAPALRSWVEAGGGVVGTGWLVYSAGTGTSPPVADIDAIMPVVTSGSYNNFYQGFVDISQGSHAITDGLSDYAVNSFSYPYTEYAVGGTKSWATILGRIGSTAIAAAGEPADGRSVYIGHTYFESTDFSAGAPDQLLEQALAWAAGSDRRDDYVFDAAVGATLTISTTSPGDGTGEPLNEIDPVVALYYLDGGSPTTPVATNDNGPDGKNAELTYVVPSGQGGRYRVAITSNDDAGDYTLRIDGRTVAAPSLTVTSVLPPDGALLSAFPATVRFDFTAGILLSTLEAADLTINGSPADSVTAIDGDTLEFSIAGALTGDGNYTLAIAAGALASVSGQPVTAFASQFNLDATPPSVVASSLDNGDAVVPGPFSVELRFSEDLNAAGFGAEDVTLLDLTTDTYYAPTSFSYSAVTDTLTVSFPSLPEGSYALRLLSGETAARDLRGNPLDGAPSFPLPSGDGIAGDDFVLNFVVDANELPFPTPLEVVAPAGSLIYDPPYAGTFAATGDTDSFTLDLEGGQQATIVLTPQDSSIAATVTLRDSSGTALATASAAAGGAVVLQSIGISASGTYHFEATANAGAGRYSVRLILNAAVESESHGGAANDVLANAQNLQPAFLAVGGGDRAGALGAVQPGNADWYRFSLGAGQTSSIVATALDGGDVQLELLDASGQLVAVGEPTFNADQVITDFTAVADGVYFARITGAGDYSLLVTRDLTFGLESAQNESPQDIGWTGEVLGALSSGTGFAGRIRVAVINDGGRAFQIVNQLNDSSVFDFEAVGVTSTQIDTLAELNAFDVVVIGDQFSQSQLATYAPALRTWVEGGGGLIGTGWLVYSAGTATAPVIADIDAVMPVNTAGSYSNFSSGTVTIVDDGHPVSEAITNYGVGSYTEYPSGGGVKSWGRVLGRISGQPVMVAGEPGNGRSAYIGHTYFESSGFSTGMADRVLEQAVAWAGLTDRNDAYDFTASAGAALVITTSTPGGGSGEPQNDLDPAIELYYLDGSDPETPVAGSDDTLDGRNARINYTIPAGQSGRYRVIVRAEEGGGSYTIQVAGHDALAPALEVVSSTPAAGALLSTYPTTYRVEFSAALLLSSVDAADLRVNGVAATGVSIIDARTLEFDISAAHVGDGIYNVTIAPAALSGLAGQSVEFFAATFDSDTTSPQVVDSSLAELQIIGPGLLTYQAQFSENIATAGLGPEDVALINTTTGAAYSALSLLVDDSTNTVTIGFADLPEGDYTLTLRSGSDAFRDRRGNHLDGAPSFPLPSGDGAPGGDFLLHFSIDTVTALFPAPLLPQSPIGSLIFEESVQSILAPTTDQDTYTLSVEQGQLITIVVEPMSGGLTPQIELLGPDFASLGESTAAGAGQVAALQFIAAPTTGAYSFVVRGAAATTGQYSLRVVLNALVERESLGGPGNNVLLGAEDLGPAILPLSGSASRLGVLGESHSEDDYYQFALAAGQAATIVAAPISGVVGVLELTDSTGSVLATSVLDEEGASRYIRGFVAPQAGTYHVRIRGVSSAYGLVVTRDADLDVEPNNSLDKPQEILAAQHVVGGLQGANSRFEANFSDALGAASLDGFTSTGLWHVTTDCGANLAGHSAPAIAYFGIDNTCNFNAGRVLGTLTSQPLSIRADSNPSLTFKYRFSGEGGGTWDRAEVRVSTNGGVTFATIATKSTHIFQNLNWTEATVDLSTYAGQTILLQFWFDSGDGVANTGLGWQVDDVVVTGVTDVQDYYSFSAVPGQSISIRTQTPGSGAGEPGNNLDPRIELYNEAGLLVASDDNGADDDSNALLTYTVPEFGGGAYTARILGANGGFYEVIFGGIDASAAGPQVVAVTPPNGSPLAVAPTELIVTFSEAVRVDGLAPSDLVFDDASVIVSSVEMIDGRTARFLLTIPGAEGIYTYALAAGAVTDLQGIASEAFAGSFDVDRSGPQVVTTAPSTQASAPFTQLTFVFDEPVDPATVSTADVFSFTGPGGGNLAGSITGISVNQERVTVTFSSQLVPGTYTMVLGPDIRDRVGNLMDQDGDGTGGETADRYTATLQLQTPDLAVTAASAPGTALFGSAVQVTYTVQNVGSDPALEGWRDSIYLSTDAILDRDDLLIKVVPAGGELGPLTALGAGGDSYSRIETINLPLNLSVTPGNYFLLVNTDHFTEQPEGNENNNVRATGSIAINLPPLPDLVVTNIVAPIEALSGQTIQIQWTVANQGTGNFSGVLRDQVFLSTDQTLGGDQLFGSFDFSGSIPAGQSITRTQTIVLPPALEGNRFVIVRTDAIDSAFEHAGEANNVTADNQAIDIDLQPLPNLQVSSVSVPPGAFSSQQVVVEWLVRNVGTGATSTPVWYDGVWLSTDDLLDDTDVFLGQSSNASYLNPGESYASSATVTLPRGIAGTFYFLVQADRVNYVFEHVAENDNVEASGPVEVQLTPPPDLQVTTVNAPPNAFSGQPLTINWQVGNLGPGNTLESHWTDYIYMSADDQLDGGDTLLGSLGHSGVLPTGGSYPASRTVNLPIGVAGDFFIFVVTDTFNQVFEASFEQNNAGLDPTAVRISLTPPPDLEVDFVNAPSGAVAGRNLSVAYSVTNFGATVTPNSSWTDRLYLSADATFDPATDGLLASRTHYGALEPFATYEESFSLTLSNTLTGTFYVFVVTDNENQVFELDKTNNRRGDPNQLAIVGLPPDLVPTSFTAPGSGEAGTSVLVSWSVQNQGVGPTNVNSWVDRVIISSDATLGGNDDLILATFDYTDHDGSLPVGGSYLQSARLVPLPYSLAPGQYHLFLLTDGFNNVFEDAAETNNASSPLTLNVTRQTADLRVNVVTAPTTAFSEDVIAVSWTAQNFGSAGTNATWWHDRVYLSADAVFGNGDEIEIDVVQRSNSLGAGAAYSMTRNIRLPFERSGDYYVFVQADSDNRVLEEGLEGNNTRAAASPLSIALRPTPNLQVTQVNAPAEAFSGQSFDLSWTVNNGGAGGTGGTGWYDTVYLSLDQIFEPGSDIYLGYRDRPTALSAGQSYTQTTQFGVPQGLAGRFYVFVATDHANYVLERGGEGNNVGYDLSSMQVSLLPPADLVVGTINVPDMAALGRNASLTFTIENRGANAARGRWFDSIYISADAQWDVGDSLFARVERVGDVAGGSSYTRTVTAPVPGVLPGQYHVIIRSDILNHIPESDESNNVGGSLDEVVLDVETLQLGVPASDALAQDQSAYYKIDLPAGETVRIRFDAASDASFTELYARFGAVPSRLVYDFSENEPFVEDPELIIPVEEDGTLYILAYGRNASGSPNYTLSAEIIPFSLRSLASSEVGNARPFTLKIEGARFGQDTEFELVDAQGNRFPAERKIVEDSVTAYVTFDLYQQPPGLFDLVAKRGGNTVELIDALTVVAGTGGMVSTDVQGAEVIRPDRTYTFQMFYGNEGDGDLPSPLILVESASGTPIGLSRATMSSAAVHVLGASLDGPLTTLRPRTQYGMPFHFASGSESAGVDIRIIPVLPTDQTALTDGDWQGIEASVRPVELSNEQWEPFWARLRPRIGSTWGSYVQMLTDMATRVTPPGAAIRDVRQLMLTVYQTSPNYLPSLAMSGRLVHAETGAALANVEVDAFQVDPDATGFRGRATTDAEGRFTIFGLAAGTYELSIGSYDFDMDRDGRAGTTSPQFTVLADADLAGVEVFVLPVDLAEELTQDNGAALALDSAGRAHIGWSRSGFLWHARHDGSVWRDAAQISQGAASNIDIKFAPNLIGGSLPGLVAVWEEGSGNESEIFYAIGAVQADGSVVWSEPQQLTDDELHDTQPAISIGPDGQILFIYAKSDSAINDDPDLYFDLVQIQPAAVTVNAAAPPEVQLLDGGGGVKIVPLGFEFPKTAIKAFGIGIKGKVQGEVAVTQSGCNLFAAGAVAAQVQFDGKELKTSLGGDGQYKADYGVDEPSCSYEFNKGRASWSVVGSVDWKNGLVHLIKYFGIQGRIAGWILEAAQNAAQKLGGFKFEAGINLKVGFRFVELEYTQGDPLDNPLRFLNPDSTTGAAVEISFGPYIKAGYEGEAEGKASGAVNFKFDVIPSFKIKEVSGSVTLEVKYPNGRYWSTTFSAGYFASGITSLGFGEGSQVQALDIDLESLTPEEILALIESGQLPLPEGMTIDAGYDPLRAIGTGNVYGTNAVLADVGSDLYFDGAPIVADGPGGQRLMAWVRDHDPYSGTGNSVWVSRFDAGAWTTAVEVPGSSGFNNSVALAYDATGKPVLVWSRADASGVTPEMSHIEYLTAYEDRDIYFSVFDGSAWSIAAALDTRAGRDADVTLAKGSSGALFLAWTNETPETGSVDTLLSRTWDGSAWSSVTIVHQADEIAEPVLGVVGGQTTLFWSQNVSAEQVTIETSLFYSQLTTGWSTPVVFSPFALGELGGVLTTPQGVHTLALADDGRNIHAWSEGSIVGVAGDDPASSGYQWAAQIPSVSGGDIEEVAIRFDGDRGALVVWTERLPGATHASEVGWAWQDRDSQKWSSAFSLGTAAGAISGLEVRAAETGDLVATWTVTDSSGRHNLFAAFWNAELGLWFQPQLVGEEAVSSAIVVADGQVGVLWMSHSAGPDKVSVFLTRWSNEIGWDAAVGGTLTRAEGQAQSLAALDGRSGPSGALIITALLNVGTGGVTNIDARIFATGIVTSLFTPDEKCCKCKKYDERTEGTDEGCGKSVEIDRERCIKITRYKPCVRRPRDPNDIVGPEGFGEAHWVPADATLGYTIRFENAADATAPAQVVEITQEFDPDIDVRTFRLGRLGFNNLVFEIPANRAFYNERLDLRETHGFFVDVAAGIDVVNRKAFWRLTTIDPETGDVPLDANVGFLPPDDAEGSGDGFVEYVVRARRTAVTGDVIDAQARIVFDTEGPIDTPPIFNTLDAGAPTSAVVALPVTADGTTFDVAWSGADDDGGSGLAFYTIYVSEDDGPYLAWLEETTLTSAQYVGEPGVRYAFYSVAHDNAGRVEAAPDEADAVTVTPGGSGAIGDFVWNDADGDGLQDGGETGIAGVIVRLLNALGEEIAATTTNEAGLYLFESLDPAGQYKVEFVLPDGYAFSPADRGSDDTLDSDVDATGHTALFTIASGDHLEWDAGLMLRGSISGTVWHDVDGDGLFDSEEIGLAAWTVFLDSDHDGQFDAGAEEFRVTDSGGNYRFDGLVPGSYVVTTVIPEGWQQTFPGAAGASAAPHGFSFTGSAAEIFSPGQITTGGTPLTAAADLVGMGQYYADPQFADLDGTGWSVVVIDTGIDVDHPFFGPDSDGNGIADRIVFQYDFADGDADASDRTSHGSHVSSVIASSDTAYPGIAPGVGIIHLKVFGDDGRGYFSSVERALQWVIANATAFHIAAVNLSLGDGFNWTQAVGAFGLADELAALAAGGVITVAAAGNNFGLYDDAPGLSYPAADPSTIAVGAVWDSDRGGPWQFGRAGTDFATDADRIASFSQRHAQMLDVVAPGAVISGANAFGGVSTLRGTSSAAPHVTGAAVLAQQVATRYLGRPLTPEEFRYLLRISGDAVVDGDDEVDNVRNTGATYRRLDLHSLAQAIVNFNGTIPGGSGGGDTDGGGPSSTHSGLPYSYSIELAPGEDRDNVDFGNQQVDTQAPVVLDVSDVSPDPRNTAIGFVEVTLSEPVDLTSFTFVDLSLTRSGENVPLDERVAITFLTGSTYQVTGLEHFTQLDGQYELTVHGAGIEDENGNAGGGSAADIWLKDSVAPTSRVAALAGVQSSKTFTIHVTGGDTGEGGPAAGVAFYDIYVSIDQAPFQLWQSLPGDAPSADFTGESNHNYYFRSVARDLAGNVEAKPVSAEALTFLPDVDLPDTEVHAVETGTATFSIQFSGTDTGGSGLNFFDVFVVVDSAAPELVGRFAAGSPAQGGIYNGVAVYQASADGDEHTYRFYSVGIDGRGNVEGAPAAPEDVQFAATFDPPAQLEVTGFDVQRGATQRSYIRYLDVLFNDSSALAELIASINDDDPNNDRIRLRRKFTLGGADAGETVDLQNKVTAADHLLQFDLLGNIGADGFYELSFDLDDDGVFGGLAGSDLHFYKLQGDVNGDRSTFGTADMSMINAAMGQTGSNLNADANGDGVVNVSDRMTWQQNRNKKLDDSLLNELDD